MPRFAEILEGIGDGLPVEAFSFIGDRPLADGLVQFTFNGDLAFPELRIIQAFTIKLIQMIGLQRVRLGGAADFKVSVLNGVDDQFEEP